jgi:hypothetical protein
MSPLITIAEIKVRENNKVFVEFSLKPKEIFGKYYLYQQVGNEKPSPLVINPETKVISMSRPVFGTVSNNKPKHKIEFIAEENYKLIIKASNDTHENFKCKVKKHGRLIQTCSNLFKKFRRLFNKNVNTRSVVI